MPVEGLAELEVDLLSAAPPPGTRFTFLAGLDNQFFLPRGQQLTWQHFDRMQPGEHRIFPLAGYSHLDTMIGRRAHRDVFPLILAALA